MLINLFPRFLLCNFRIGTINYNKHLKMLDEQKSALPLRFCICGYEERVNNVLYCPPLEETKNHTAVIYFGGDIQDYKENMESHRDNKNYIKWSLDNTAKILQAAFSDSHIIVIRPSRMEYKTFSCFDNFVPSGNCGVPEHVSMHHSLQHLETLLKNITIELKNNFRKNQMNEEKQLNDHQLRIIGFSKGCVVLNQFLHEFHTVATSPPTDLNIISKISDMYWLDGGHSGGKNTWITSRPLLETFSALGIKVHIHVSPYQIQDDRRPWIKKEEKIFYNTLSSLKAPIERVVHFPDILPSIFQHFNILDKFHQKHSSSDGNTT